MPDLLLEREAFWHRLQRGLMAPASLLETQAERWAADLRWLLVEGKAADEPETRKQREPASAVVALIAARLTVSRERARAIIRRMDEFTDEITSTQSPTPSMPATRLSDWSGDIVDDQVTKLESRYLRFAQATLGALWLLCQLAANASAALSETAQHTLEGIDFGLVVEALGKRVVEAIHGRSSSRLERIWLLECLLRMAVYVPLQKDHHPAIRWDSLTERIFSALNARWFLMDDPTSSGLAICLLLVLLSRLSSGQGALQKGPKIPAEERISLVRRLLVSTSYELGENLALEAPSDRVSEVAAYGAPPGRLSRLLALLHVLMQSTLVLVEDDPTARETQGSRQTSLMEPYPEDLLGLAFDAVQELLQGPLSMRRLGASGRLAVSNVDPAWACWLALERILEALALPVRLLALEKSSRSLLERIVESMVQCLQSSSTLSRSFWISVWMDGLVTEDLKDFRFVHWPGTGKGARFWRELCILLPLTADMVFVVAQAAIVDPISASLALHWLQHQCLTFVEPWGHHCADTVERQLDAARDETGLLVYRVTTKCIRKTTSEPETGLPAGTQGLLYEALGVVIWKVRWDGLMAVSHCPAGLELLYRFIRALSQFDVSFVDDCSAVPNDVDGPSSGPLSWTHQSMLSRVRVALGQAEEAERLRYETAALLWQWIQTHWQHLGDTLDPRCHVMIDEHQERPWRLARARAVAALVSFAQMHSSSKLKTGLGVDQISARLLDPLGPVPEMESEALWLARAWSQLGVIPPRWNRFLMTLPTQLVLRKHIATPWMLESAQMRFELVSRAMRKSAKTIGNMHGSAQTAEWMESASPNAGIGSGEEAWSDTKLPSWPWWQHSDILAGLWSFACQLLDRYRARVTDSQLNFLRSSTKWIDRDAATQNDLIDERYASDWENTDVSNRESYLLLALLRFLQSMLALALMTPLPGQLNAQYPASRYIGSDWQRQQWQCLVADPARAHVFGDVLRRCLHPESAALFRLDPDLDGGKTIEACSRKMAACAWHVWALLHLATAIYCCDDQQAHHLQSCFWPDANRNRLMQLMLLGLEQDPRSVLVFLVAAQTAGYQAVLETLPNTMALADESTFRADSKDCVESKASSPESTLPGTHPNRQATRSLQDSRLWMALWHRRLFLPQEQSNDDAWLAPLATLVFRLCVRDCAIAEAHSWLTSLLADILLPCRRQWRAQLPPWPVALATSMVLASFLELVSRLWVQGSKPSPSQWGHAPPMGVDSKLVASWLEVMDLLSALSPAPAITEQSDDQWPESLLVLRKHEIDGLLRNWSESEQVVWKMALATDLGSPSAGRAPNKPLGLLGYDLTFMPSFHQTVLITSFEVLCGALQAPQPSAEHCVLDWRSERTRWSATLARLSMALLKLIAQSGPPAGSLYERLAWSEFLFRLSGVWTRPETPEAQSSADHDSSGHHTILDSFVPTMLRTIELQLERLSQQTRVATELMDHARISDDLQSFPLSSTEWQVPGELLEAATLERLVLALCQMLERVPPSLRSVLIMKNIIAGEIVCLRLLEHAGRWPSVMPAVALLCHRWLSDDRLRETTCGHRFVRAVFEALSLEGQSTKMLRGHWWLTHLLLDWAVRSPRCAERICQRGLCCLEPIPRAQVRQRVTTDQTRPFLGFQLYLLQLHLYAVLMYQAAAHGAAATQQRLWSEVYAFVASFEGAPLSPPWLCRLRPESPVRGESQAAPHPWTQKPGRTLETSVVWHWVLCEELYAVSCFVEALLSCRHVSNQFVQDLEAQWSPGWMQQLSRQVIGAIGDALRCLRSASSWLTLPLQNFPPPSFHSGLWGGPRLAAAERDRLGIPKPHLRPQDSDHGGSLLLSDLVERAMLRLISSALALSGSYLVLAPTMNWTDPETPSLGMVLSLALHWLNILPATSAAGERQGRRIRLLEVSLLLLLQQLMHHVERRALPLGVVEECCKRLIGLESRLNSIAEAALSSARHHQLLVLFHSVEMLLSKGRCESSTTGMVSIRRDRERISYFSAPLPR
jgi:hypothetical protein